VDGEGTKRLARDYRRSRQTVRRRNRAACHRLVAIESLPTLPPGDVPLVLIIDGFWLRFRRLPWVLYHMAVKPAGLPRAFFLDPVMLPGKETVQCWRQALTTIPDGIRPRIKALVCDGITGYKSLARSNGWLLQRCHRHLDVVLSGKLRYRTRKLRGGEVRAAIYSAICEARITADLQRLGQLQSDLKSHARHPDISCRVRGVAREFLRGLLSFRTYLDYPELQLPATTNCLESRHKQLRPIVRGVNRPAAALLRIRAYTRMRPTIACNHTQNPQK
jgi:hypothetical protein